MQSKRCQGMKGKGVWKSCTMTCVSCLSCFMPQTNSLVVSYLQNAHLGTKYTFAFSLCEDILLTEHSSSSDRL